MFVVIKVMNVLQTLNWLLEQETGPVYGSRLTGCSKVQQTFQRLHPVCQHTERLSKEKGLVGLLKASQRPLLPFQRRSQKRNLHRRGRKPGSAGSYSWKKWPLTIRWNKNFKALVKPHVTAFIRHEDNYGCTGAIEHALPTDDAVQV